MNVQVICAVDDKLNSDGRKIVTAFTGCSKALREMVSEDMVVDG